MPRLVLILVLGVCLTGCAGETTPAADQGDAPSWSADQSQLPDQYVWPDQGQSNDQRHDQQIVWPDSYAGRTFGCVSDTECFGQRCCPTPWGVRVCAATCPR